MKTDSGCAVTDAIAAAAFAPPSAAMATYGREQPIPALPEIVEQPIVIVDPQTYVVVGVEP